QMTEHNIGLRHRESDWAREGRDRRIENIGSQRGRERDRSKVKDFIRRHASLLVGNPRPCWRDAICNGNRLIGWKFYGMHGTGWGSRRNAGRDPSYANDCERASFDIGRHWPPSLIKCRHGTGWHRRSHHRAKIYGCGSVDHKAPILSGLTQKKDRRSHRPLLPGTARIPLYARPSWLTFLA